MTEPRQKHARASRPTVFPWPAAITVTTPSRPRPRWVNSGSTRRCQNVRCDARRLRVTMRLGQATPTPTNPAASTSNPRVAGSNPARRVRRVSLTRRRLSWQARPRPAPSTGRGGSARHEGHPAALPGSGGFRRAGPRWPSPGSSSTRLGVRCSSSIRATSSVRSSPAPSRWRPMDTLRRRGRSPCRSRSRWRSAPRERRA